MRFKAQLANVGIGVLDKFTASLASLGKICWIRLEPDYMRFTVIPDQGTQVWGQLPREAVFDSYTLTSMAGVIDLEVPLASFNKALRSALNSTSAQVRLTKKGTTPFLAFTIVTASWTAPRNALGVVSEVEGVGTTDHPMQAMSDQSTVPMGTSTTAAGGTAATGVETTAPTTVAGTNFSQAGPRERETVITQEVPVRVLNATDVEGLHEPRCAEPDVHIILPTLSQLKSISERFTKLALGTGIGNLGGLGGGGGGSTGPSRRFSTPSLKAPKLELSANMRGSMKLAIANDTLRISSVWSGLANPAIDPTQLSQGTLENLPSERMRQKAAEDPDDEACWAKVQINGRDWGRVLSVGRLSPRVVASFINNTALVLYVYLRGTDDACLTYYINSYVT